MSVRAEKQMAVYAVANIPPEVQAYSMAKYSRSSQGMADSVKELSGQRAANFLNTFYFQYGHGSIADMAHVALAADNVMIADAPEVCGDPQFDGQERSTRYQDFSVPQFGIPTELRGSDLEPAYDKSCFALFDAYSKLKDPLAQYMFEQNKDTVPDEMDEAAKKRTLNARAFDRVRYLLPSSTLTGFAMVTSARSAERMISRLMSHPLQNVQELGARIKSALQSEVPFNPMVDALIRMIQSDDSFNLEKQADLVDAIKRITVNEAPLAPTLVKYTAPSHHRIQIDQDCEAAAAQYLNGIPADKKTSGWVTYFGAMDPNLELAATALYKGSHHSYAQALEVVQGLGNGEVSDLVDLWYKNRGEHDAPPQETWTGYGNTFDLNMDYGAFRDLNRHRRGAKVVQNFGPELGYDIPKDIIYAGLEDEYRAAMDQAVLTAETINDQFPRVGQYSLPLGSRIRMLMRMDDAQVQYITELRTKPGGHFSYREATYNMYELYNQANPTRGKHIRAVHPSVDSFWGR